MFLCALILDMLSQRVLFLLLLVLLVTVVACVMIKPMKEKIGKGEGKTCSCDTPEGISQYIVPADEE
jgi:hypothetical protein